jgi:hypothetical protein
MTTRQYTRLHPVDSWWARHQELVFSLLFAGIAAWFLGAWLMSLLIGR